MAAGKARGPLRDHRPLCLQVRLFRKKQWITNPDSGSCAHDPWRFSVPELRLPPAPTSRVVRRIGSPGRLLACR